MTKRVFIIHGWGGSPESGWKPWLATQLKKRGFKVHNLAMPDTDSPNVRAWVVYLAKNIGKPDKNTILVGHSLGCPTILRYLESVKNGNMIGGAVLVAGPADDTKWYPEISPFLIPFKWNTIRLRCMKFIAIYSDDDYWVPLQHGGIIRFRLGAQLIIKHGMKHFSGDDGCRMLPVVLEAILSIMKKQ